MKHLTILLLFFCQFVQAQTWNKEEKQDISNSIIQARKYTLFNTNLFDLRHVLSTANTINIPMPDGSLQTFSLQYAPVMQEALATKYPLIKTYLIFNEKGENGRIDITHKGFHAMIFMQNGTLFIDPISLNGTNTYIVYYKKDFYTNKELPVCLSESNPEDESLFQQKSTAASNGTTLRTYRIAVSATAEYTQFHGGTVADGLAAIVTTINRITGVYEREFTIRLVLVANNDQIIYTNTSTDPFTNPSNPSNLLFQNQSSIDNVIGSANYDIGHVVGRDGSGLASFGVVCKSNNKAQGTTGVPNPIGDPFDIDYVAHEIGHQFGGSHTFNGNSGSCSGNIETNSAYEPGSGTTIMAYAGICSPQNTQNNSDDYFHTRSFDQIVNYTTIYQGNSCPQKTPTNNAIPQIEVLSPANKYIPINTPFELTASATDIDGNYITYCWEQYDKGPSGAPNTPSGNAPIFRSFLPKLSPTRIFPQLSNILNNTQTMGEILPSYDRTLHFRVTARDNMLGGGAVIYDDYTVDVDANSGPFEITSQNNNAVWLAGNTYDITWDVAGTNNAPVSCANVDIYLSLDGGQTFEYLLAQNVPNNGTYSFTAPNLNSTSIRIKVKCSDNIFFDINNDNVDLQLDCSAFNTAIDVQELPSSFNWCENSVGMLEVNASSTDLGIASYQWYFNNVPINGATSASLQIPNIQASNGGDYYCAISNGCNTVFSSTISVFVGTSPILPVITETNGFLVSSVPFGNQWYLNGEPLLGETNDSLMISENGVYSVQSIAGLCSAFSLPKTVGIKDLNQLIDVAIVPNPSKGIYHINVGNWNEPCTLIITDILGQELSVQSFYKETQLNIQDKPKGVYIATLISNGKQGVYKLVKE